MNEVQRKPWWLYPNLMSLDAPLVAVAWLHLFANTWRLGYHPWQAYLALGIVVWGIYVADRLLDVSLQARPETELEPRHQFHQRYRKVMSVLLVAGAIVSLVIVLTAVPRAIFSYLTVGSVLVAGFFGLSMLASKDPKEVGLSKNILAGVTFAFGTAMMAHLYRMQFGMAEMLLSREFICFAVLCILNISAIDFWEHAAQTNDMEVKASDELAITMPLVVLAFASLLFAIQESSRSLSQEEMATAPFFYATLTAAALMYVLNRIRARFSMNALRVLADVALLVPVLVFHVAKGR